MALKTEGKSAKSPTSDGLVASEHTSEHSSQKQSTAQNQNTSAKCPITDVRSSSEHTTEYHLVSDKILKVKQNIKSQVEARSCLQKIITEVLIF